MSTSVGHQSTIENYEEISFSPQKGWERRSGITGRKAAVKALLNELAAQGLSFTYACDQSPNATIRFETPGLVEGGSAEPGQEVPTSSWEYLATRAEIDILEGDLAGQNGTTNVNGIVTAEKKLLRNRINGMDVTYPDPFSTEFDTIFKLIDQGVRSLRVFVPTLKVSRLVSLSYTVPASLANVGRIISTATLNVQEAIPSTLLFSLPNDVSGKTGFVYAWYKNHPNVQQAGNRWNISQEWDYGLWPVALLGTVL
jgi:hypothetical protein